MAKPVNILSPQARLRSILSGSPVSPLFVYNFVLINVYLVPVKGLDGREIVQIACGQQHSVALTSEGYVGTPLSLCVLLIGIIFRLVYVWGYNGYCRLGLGNQQDVLIPKLVPQVPLHVFTYIPF